MPRRSRAEQFGEALAQFDRLLRQRELAKRLESFVRTSLGVCAGQVPAPPQPTRPPLSAPAATTGELTHDDRRRRRVNDRVKLCQRRRVARGRCRQCGLRLAAGSKSRCLACLEQHRRSERQRRGVSALRPTDRGGRLIGHYRERRRALFKEQKRAQRGHASRSPQS
jgi:hypothetical protein